MTFKDSKGTRGQSFVRPTSKTLSSRGNKVSFEARDSNTMTMIIPSTPKIRRVKVTKKNLIKLAHWLLDHCSDPGE
jgi:hypothetical protein